MFANRPIIRIELLQRELFNLLFEAIWEGEEDWCLFSITVFEHLPELEIFTVLHIKFLAFAIALHIGWDHYA